MPSLPYSLLECTGASHGHSPAFRGHEEMHHFWMLALTSVQPNNIFNEAITKVILEDGNKQILKDEKEITRFKKKYENKKHRKYHLKLCT